MKSDRRERLFSGFKRHSRHTALPPEADPPRPITVARSDPAEFPAIHLRIHPITDEGAEVFTKNVPDIGSVLKDSVRACWKFLYNDEKHLFPTNVRSITIFIRPMDGVAYTTGNWMDGDCKEIHFNSNYIRNLSSERVRDEIRGVLVHEMVHVWQHNGYGTAPGGLIEGIADYVRLQAGFAPPHWRRGRGDHWDAGYDATGFFLDWIEKKHDGFVRGINAILKDAKWDVGVFKLITGKSVDELWAEYQKDVNG